MLHVQRTSLFCIFSIRTASIYTAFYAYFIQFNWKGHLDFGSLSFWIRAKTLFRSRYNILDSILMIVLPLYKYNIVFDSFVAGFVSIKLNPRVVFFESTESRLNFCSYNSFVLPVKKNSKLVVGFRVMAYVFFSDLDLARGSGGDRSVISYSGPTFAAIKWIFQQKIHKKKFASLIVLWTDPRNTFHLLHFIHTRDIETIYGKSDFHDFTHTSNEERILMIVFAYFPDTSSPKLLTSKVP